MKIQIHTRNADLAEDFKNIATEKLNSMERFSIVIDRVEVEVLHEANPHQGKHNHKVVVIVSDASSTGFAFYVGNP